MKINMWWTCSKHKYKKQSVVCTYVPAMCRFMNPSLSLWDRVCPSPADESYGYNHLRTSASFRDALTGAQHTFSPSPDVIAGGDVPPAGSWTLPRPTAECRQRLASPDPSGAQRLDGAQNQPWERAPSWGGGGTCMYGEIVCTLQLWYSVLLLVVMQGYNATGVWHWWYRNIIEANKNVNMLSGGGVFVRAKHILLLWYLCDIGEIISVLRDLHM